MRLCAFAIVVFMGCGGDEPSGDTGNESTGDDDDDDDTSTSTSSTSTSTTTTTGPMCGDDETECNGVCVDVRIDPNNCGECGNALPEGIACEDGEPSCSLQGLEYCAGACVDVLNDDENCGGCGQSCGEFNCMGNGCCHVFEATTEPRSCNQICADAGMTCSCPDAISVSYMGTCDIVAINLVDCNEAPLSSVTCGEMDECECTLDRINCGCEP